MGKVTTLFGLLLALGVLGAAASHAESGGAVEAHIMVGVMDTEPPLNAPMQAIVRDAYVAIGRVPHFVFSPPRRSLMLAGTGMLDAELFRAPDVEQLYPDLVRVDFPLYRVQVIAYTHDATAPIYGCPDLRNYRVGVIRGIVLMENCAEGAQQVARAPDTARLAQMLRNRRVDVILVERAMGELQIAPVVGMEIVALPQPLLTVPVHHYVHRKQAHLAAPLAEALRDLHRNGEIDFRLAQWRTQAYPAAIGPETLEAKGADGPEPE